MREMSSTRKSYQTTKRRAIVKGRPISMTTAGLKKSAITGVIAAALVLAGAAITTAQAKTVKVELTAKEVTVPLDNEGHTVAAWTYNGQVPGPLIRATEGDTIEFTLKNDATNKKSHSIDMHSMRTDVLTNFASIKPGETKTFSYVPDHAGVFFYHCGSDPMIQHIARGMIGAVIV